MLKLPAVVVAVCVLAVGCAADDPDRRATDWEDAFDRTNKASASGDHQQAISVSESFLKKHPDNVDGHLMAGSALVEAADAASDQRRPEQYTEAASHYKRALELSRNQNWRLLAAAGLVRIYRKDSLNNPQEAIKYARVLASDRPADPGSYTALLSLLSEAKQYEEALVVLADMRKSIPPTEENAAEEAGLLHDLVALHDDFPKDKASAVLSDGVNRINESIGKYGRTKALVQALGMLQRARALTESDPARASAFTVEYQKTFEELDRLTK